MIIEINDKGFLDREIVIKLPKKELHLAKEKKIIDLSKSLNLKGFRKGFIPYNIIVSRFKTQIDNEVLNDLLYKELVEFIKKNSINFVKFPILKTSDHTSSNEYLIFIFELEIYPIININFDKIKIVKYKSIITDHDIDVEIARLRNLYGTWKIVDSVAIGDKITFEIFDKNNNMSVFSDTDVIVNDTYTSLIGFLDFIINKKISLDYSVFFSNKSIRESLDIDSSFFLKIINIKRFYISDLDFNLYNKIGFDATYDFRSFIKTHLNSIQFDRINTLLKHDMLSSLVVNNDFNIPNSMLDDKFSEYKNKNEVKDKNEIINELKLDLLLKDIVKKFNIYVSKDEVLKMLQDKYKNQTQFDENFYTYIENEMYIEKIKEVLLTKVYVEEKEIKFGELLNIGNSL